MNAAYQRFAAAMGERLTRHDAGRCPAHPDKMESLSVSECADGVLLKCHAGCDTSAVVAAIGLQMADLFNVPRERKRSFADRITDVYRYETEDGTHVFDIVRLEDPKTFRPRKLDGSYNRKGCPLVLYNLPAVVAAKLSGETVHYFEGEKDCNNARRHGLCATTHAGGAKSWKPEYAKQLEGVREVALVPDNDEPGLALMNEIAAALSRLNSPPAVRLLAPLGAAGGYDFSDWLADGGTNEAFQALVAAAPLYGSSEALASVAGTGEAKVPSLPRILTVDEVLNLPSGFDWLIEGKVPKRAHVGIVAASGAGKSFLIQSMLLAMATRSDWYGHATSCPGASLLIVGEGFGGVRNRLAAWLDWFGVLPEELRDRFAVCRVPVDITDAALCASVMNEVQKRSFQKVDCIMIDTLCANAFPGFNDNAAEDMGTYFRAAHRLQTEFDCTVGSVHHFGHEAKRARGHSSFYASLDVELRLELAGDVRTLSLGKTRDIPPFPSMRFKLTPHMDAAVLEELNPGLALVAPEELTPAQRQVLLTLAEHWEGLPFAVADWVRESGYSRSQLSELRDALIARGLVDGNRKGYILTQGGAAEVERIRNVRLSDSDKKRTIGRQNLSDMSPLSLERGHRTLPEQRDGAA